MNIKYKNLVFAFLMALSMSSFVSFVLVSINFGYGQTFFHNWLKIWSQAFICAFLGAYFFPRFIQQIMNKINFVEKPPIVKGDMLLREQEKRIEIDIRKSR